MITGPTGATGALLTIQQAMAVAQVSRSTLCAWIRLDKVQYVRTPGGRVRIVEASLWRDGHR